MVSDESSYVRGLDEYRTNSGAMSPHTEVSTVLGLDTEANSSVNQNWIDHCSGVSLLQVSLASDKTDD